MRRGKQEKGEWWCTGNATIRASGIGVSNTPSRKKMTPPRGIRKFHWQLGQVPYEYRSLVGEAPHPWAPLWSKIVRQHMHSIGLGTCRLDRSGESQPTLPTPDRSRLTEILTGPGVFRCAACSSVRWKYLCANRKVHRIASWHRILFPPICSLCV